LPRLGEGCSVIRERADSHQGDRKVALVVGAIRFGLRQSFCNRERLAVSGACLLPLPEAQIEVAHPVIRRREVALVVDAIGFGLRQPLRNRERLAMGVARLLALPRARQRSPILLYATERSRW